MVLQVWSVRVGGGAGVSASNPFSYPRSVFVSTSFFLFSFGGTCGVKTGMRCYVLRGCGLLSRGATYLMGCCSSPIECVCGAEGRWGAWCWWPWYDVLVFPCFAWRSPFGAVPS